MCDNGGYAVIERLQVGQGGRSYNNMLRDSIGSGSEVRVDFAAHARALGAEVLTPASLSELSVALEGTRSADRTTVIVLPVREADWTEGGAFWQVGVPEVSDLDSVRAARTRMDDGLRAQRKGV